jgi:tartrate dehydratase alpha subunit/fumarate hydratase class I-like protein
VRFEGFAGSSEDAVNEGVRRAYRHADNPLRASVVEAPLFSRRNTRDNTPAVVHMRLPSADFVLAHRVEWIARHEAAHPGETEHLPSSRPIESTGHVSDDVARCDWR